MHGSRSCVCRAVSFWWEESGCYGVGSGMVDYRGGGVVDVVPAPADRRFGQLVSGAAGPAGVVQDLADDVLAALVFVGEHVDALLGTFLGVRVGPTFWRRNAG